MFCYIVKLCYNCYCYVFVMYKKKYPVDNFLKTITYMIKT